MELSNLGRSKILTIDWSATVTPVKNYRYFFGFDAEIKEGILTGLQPVIAETDSGYDFGNTTSGATVLNTFQAFKYAYITLVNKNGETVVSNLPVDNLFLASVIMAGVQPNAGLNIRPFLVNVDPAQSYITFNYNTGDLPNPYPVGINFIWYYKKRIN